MKFCYVPKSFYGSSKGIIDKANEICAEYMRLGFDLTLRQLYYQFVARGYIANKDTEYKRLGSIVNDARLAGLIDWNYLTDRTRNLARNPHWSSPSDIIDSAYGSYARDKWEDQPYHVEVWVEKEALAGIVEREASRQDVAWFACRGYVSQSEMYGAAQRLLRYQRQGKQNVVIHLGDHDPSGIDMTRDIDDRLALFGARVEINRIALNMDQIEQYSPPPNPAKLTDSRCECYMQRFGNESWELDALDPTTLSELIGETIAQYREEELYGRQLKIEAKERESLKLASENWGSVASFLDRNYGDDSDESEDEEE